MNEYQFVFVKKKIIMELSLDFTALLDLKKPVNLIIFL